MRILLYGFGSYKQFRENITAKILRSVPKRAGLKKVIFPVRFDRAQFVNAIKNYRPDVVLGLGQSSRAEIEIEARASNRRRTSKKQAARPIRRAGAKKLPTTLKLKLGRQADLSQNAGDYVCNYSMYVILDHIRRRRLRVRFGFIHIPYDYSLRKAKRCVMAAVRTLEARSKAHGAKR